VLFKNAQMLGGEERAAQCTRKYMSSAETIPTPQMGIFQQHLDDQGEYKWLVTLWKATKEEVKVYEKNS
jgi:hypothetical protein